MSEDGKLENEWWGDEHGRFMSLEPGQDAGEIVGNQEVYRSLDVEQPASYFGNDYLGGRRFEQDSWAFSNKGKESNITRATVISQGIIESVVEDEPPSPPGGYIEPNYHFNSTSHPTTLFPCLGDVLKASGVDFTVKLAKYKYKCVCYRDGGRIPFDVRIFLTGTGSKKYAVEFQRRAGDVVHFSKIYRDLKSVLAAKGHVVELEPETPAWPAFDLDDLPDFPADEAPTPADYAETVNCLKAMADSDCVDIQSQAVQALAQLTSSVEEAKKAVYTSGWDVLIESLASSTEDVHRCAISGVANLLLDNRDACERVHRTRGLVSAIFALASSDVLQVARESTRALASLGKTLGNGIVDDDFKKNLQKLAQAQDTLTRGYLLELQDAVGIVV